jgi:hypothetical protein
MRSSASRRPACAHPAGAHKSDTGKVALGLGDEDPVRAAAKRIGCPVLVQSQISGGAELLAGVVQDPVFGPLVAFGPGGVFAELIGDAAFRIAPLTDVDAEEVKVLIQPQMRGCHAWSVNGGTVAASRSARVATGGPATFTDNDIMPHKLILTKCPAVKFVGNASMNHMGASVKVAFTKAGTYRFTTKPGEDYKAWP